MYNRSRVTKDYMEEPMTITRIQCIVVNLVLFILFGFAVSASANSMKIAVATTGPAKTADISQQAGRSLFFLFFDGKGNFLEAVENPSKDLSRGAGQSTASFIAKKGATLIIAGSIGCKMQQALRGYRIEYTEETGVAYDVVQTVIQDR
ncbi:MAG: hypothetical protein GWM81_01805 [Desulfobacterales bacterium]|jgi:predicted Fe-Mo cluster-binding NifX family protein|nr:hypothetical protein [Desulfobacterales bacterium]